MENFSVLMSLYYKENPSYLRQALDSVFKNTVQPDQVVLVLDGPITDELLNVVEEYKINYPVMDVYPQKQNKGLSTALNIGLSKCRNEIVFRMDTDDINYPDRFEKMLKLYQENPNLDMAGSFESTIDENGDILPIINKFPTDYSEIKKKIWMCPFSHPTMTFKKSSILKVGSYNPSSGPRQDDYELWFRCIAGGLYAVNLPEPLLYYRFFGDSILRNDIKVGWWRMKVGLKGCWKCKCSLIGYLGVCYPFLRALLPLRVRKQLYLLSEKMHVRG